MPIPPTKESPPAALIVSVQPGVGSCSAPIIIEGRKRRTGSFGFLLFLKVLSAMDFVNVYVFGHAPRIDFKFSSYSLTDILSTLAMTSSESSCISYISSLMKPIFSQLT